MTLRNALLLTVLALPLPAPAAMTSACPSQPDVRHFAAQLLQHGNDAYVAGDHVTAASDWTRIRQCAAATPEWPKAVYNLGLLEMDRRNFPVAIEYFHAVIDSHPNDREEGGDITETNRNYTFRSAMAISECYESMGRYRDALRYARLAKTRYPFYSWCGTCTAGVSRMLNKRIAYLAVRTSRAQFWGPFLLLGVVGVGILRRSHAQQ